MSSSSFSFSSSFPLRFSLSAAALTTLYWLFTRSSRSSSYSPIYLPPRSYFPPLINCICNGLSSVRSLEFCSPCDSSSSIAESCIKVETNKGKAVIDLNSSSYPVSFITEQEEKKHENKSIMNHNCIISPPVDSVSSLLSSNLIYSYDPSGALFSSSPNSSSSPVYHASISSSLVISSLLLVPLPASLSIVHSCHNSLLVSYSNAPYLDLFPTDFSCCYRIHLPFSSCCSLVYRSSCTSIIAADDKGGCLWEICWK
jgi:hypothetical protein